MELRTMWVKNPPHGIKNYVNGDEMFALDRNHQEGVYVIMYVSIQHDLSFCLLETRNRDIWESVWRELCGMVRYEVKAISKEKRKEYVEETLNQG